MHYVFSVVCWSVWPPDYTKSNQRIYNKHSPEVCFEQSFKFRGWSGLRPKCRTRITIQLNILVGLVKYYFNLITWSSTIDVSLTSVRIRGFFVWCILLFIYFTSVAWFVSLVFSVWWTAAILSLWSPPEHEERSTDDGIWAQNIKWKIGAIRLIKKMEVKRWSKIDLKSLNHIWEGVWGWGGGGGVLLSRKYSFLLVIQKTSCVKHMK